TPPATRNGASSDQPQRDGTGRARGRCAGPAGQAEMRRAVARPRALWMAAEGNRLALLVTAIGVAAVAGPELEQRDQWGLDAHATQFHGFGGPEGRFGWLGSKLRRGWLRRHGPGRVGQRRHERRTRHVRDRGKTHPPSPAKHCTSRVSRSKG